MIKTKRHTDLPFSLRTNAGMTVSGTIDSEFYKTNFCPNSTFRKKFKVQKMQCR